MWSDYLTFCSKSQILGEKSDLCDVFSAIFNVISAIWDINPIKLSKTISALRRNEHLYLIPATSSSDKKVGWGVTSRKW